MVWLELVRERLGAFGVERVYLFISHARGIANRCSNLDIGICQPAPLPVGLLSGLRERLEEYKFALLGAGRPVGCAACAADVRREGRGGVDGFAQRLSMARKALLACPSQYIYLMRWRLVILWGDL